MCDTCGCNVTSGNRHLLQPAGKLEKTADGKSAVTVLQSLLSENDHQALHNRQHFDQHGVLAINLMSSPGSGKTALLEATIDALADQYRIAVIEGDLETENDAERIRARGVTAIQIATGSACHLDAHMVHDALHQLNLADYDLIFIENVGNLVCPASFDLGHHHNITLLSVTEGDDKPAKYPVMFRAADLMLLTKTDLLAVLDDFDPQKAEHCLRQLANPAPMLSLSATRQQGMQAWFDWLDNALTAHQQRLEQGETVLPKIQADGARLHAGDAAHP
ncbi:hydrogenase nickel incorporation protein HypB [Thiohalophilus thiocyanatoxydans]|uniref:Hydrogenase maturation factor HypB n=1 Tax=Thiohalophilus thiocyanatoxydans TaxID=381308 RepID=A0A4R8IIG2_9GAMM|nr:hydrogenase nickel incorporation protein HypB [Thiohalophilus thiocyanatoxydans]TDY00058.1 hydrogenase nickel incorporation protein HypB [Thiohalophilus thiocyanatoxydans]